MNCDPTHHLQNPSFRQKPVGSVHDISLDIEPESHHQIDYKGRTEGDEGGIDKVQPDLSGPDAHPFSQLLADTKG